MSARGRRTVQTRGLRVALLAAALVIAGGGAVSALAVPALQGRVDDYAGMMSAQTRGYLEQKLADLERTDSTQIVVLTVPSLEGESIEQFSIGVAEKWGIGQKGKDNGALLVVSKGDRKVRIEVGYGLEGSLTDLIAGRIVDNIILPDFKAGDFDQGFVQGVDAMISVVKGEYTGTGTLPGERTAKRSPGAYLVPIVIAFIVVAIMGSRRRVLGGVSGAFALPLLALLFFSPGLIVSLILIPIGFALGFLTPWSMFFSGMGRGRWGGGGFYGGGFWSGGGGGGGFGGGSSGGFSGGGFSGGGGGFGGGGASGGW